jgi:antitoxin HicB
MRKTELDRFAFLVRPLADDEGGGYLCEFPDLPGCVGDGDTIEEAVRDGRAALRSCLEALRELGRPVPAAGGASGQWRMRAPRSLHRRLAERADAEGVSLNTLAVSLLSEGLGRREAARPRKRQAVSRR